MSTPYFSRDPLNHLCTTSADIRGAKLVSNKKILKIPLIVAKTINLYHKTKKQIVKKLSIKYFKRRSLFTKTQVLIIIIIKLNDNRHDYN